MASTAPPGTAIHSMDTPPETVESANNSTAPAEASSKSTSEETEAPPEAQSPEAETRPPNDRALPDARETNDQTPNPRALVSTQLNFQTQDGRVRNPVPSKLKGKTDERNGNFSVMQIDFARPEITERDLAAKRTSEGTEAAARRAMETGYRPVKRSRLVWVPLQGETPRVVLPAPLRSPKPPEAPRHSQGRGPTLAPAHPPGAPPSGPRPAPAPAPGPPPPAVPASVSPRPVAPPPPSQHGQPAQYPVPKPRIFWSPEGTKHEQARLLTLLRSLDPASVVDQVCKALAYFGGIPDSPPPPDGVFPESDTLNGSGALFISWLAEIFPHLQGQPLPKPPSDRPLRKKKSTGRPRGRPKGSKTKNRKADKEKKPRAGKTPAEDANGSANSTEPAVEDGSALLSKPPKEAPEPTIASQGNQPDRTAQGGPGEAVDTNQSVLSTPGSKKRGRPKGSKNRSKPAPTPKAGTTDPVSIAPASQQQNQAIDSASSRKTTASHSTSVARGAQPSGVSEPQGSINTVNEDASNHGAVLASDSVASSSTEITRVLLPQQAQLSQHQKDGQAPSGPSRKRKPSRPSQTSNQGLANISPETSNATPQPATVTSAVERIQKPQAKRRRISKETAPDPGLGGSDSQASGAETSVSPNISTNVNLAGHQSLGSSSFDHSAQMNSVSNFRGGMNERIQPQPQQQQQQQTSNVNQYQQPQDQQQQQQQQQQQPSSNTIHQHAVQHVTSPVSSRQRVQLPGAQNGPATLTTQQQAYLQHQQHQQQRQQQMQQQQRRQLANQYAQSAAASTSFNQTMGTISPVQFRQSMGNQTPTSNYGPSQPPQQQQQQQQQGQQANVNSFQDYSTQDYLGMNYNSLSAGNSAAVAAAAAAFGGQTQLEAALAEPNMREHIYHAIGHR